MTPLVPIRASGGFHTPPAAPKKAKEFGVCVVSIANCNHIGRVGEYSELLAQQNLVSIIWCNADPAVAAFGGKDRLLGTNPFAAGIPSNGDPVIANQVASGIEISCPVYSKINHSLFSTAQFFESA